MPKDGDMPEKSGRARSGKARMEKLSEEERRELGRLGAKKRWGTGGMKESGVLLYQSEDGKTRIDVRLEDETVWLSQSQMADLFQVSRPNVNIHLKNLFAEGELSEASVVKDSLTTAGDGKGYQTKFYNLDVIISVGYRVKSHRGTQFRIWATQRLKEYIVKGFALDDERLKNAGTRNDYFDELIRRVREIRASERNFYRKVTDVYATSADYDVASLITEKFFATVQNKFHYAIHQHTAAELIAERADSTKENMGLYSWQGERVKKSDVTVAKNYLAPDEIDSLNLLVDQYLSFAELQARQRKLMHMKDWASKLDDFLKLNDREILTSAGRITKVLADEHAEAEYLKYSNSEKAQVDLSDFDKYLRRIESQRSKD
jgi:hypothetical protein